jgi:hypothetical protein
MLLLMEGDAPQAPVAQEVQPEVSKVPQTPQQSPTVPQAPPPKPEKKLKIKKIALFLILIPVLILIAYGIFIAVTYWNCSKTTPKACEIGKCSFSLSGFTLVTNMKADCCGNEICEVGETSSDCTADCPSCDDDSECTKDSYDYGGKMCIHEQIFAPCHVRPITLSTATPETDYQIKIALTASAFDYSRAMTNGEDIRFFDENDNPLSFWIEDWNDAEGESSVWVKVASSETKKIYMYYGYPDANSASAGSAVFEFFEGFDYESESELLKVWNKHGSPTIELSDGVVTIATSGTEEDEEHGGQHIYKDVGSSTLVNNLVEMSVKRFSDGGYANHMANIGYTSSIGGSISDGDSWAILRYNPSPDGGTVVFGGNHGGITSPPVGSFNTIMIYHQEGVSYAYEPPGTKVAQYSWPRPLPPGDYVLLGGQTYESGYGKASYDWIRVRKYASSEPSVVIGNEEAVSDESPIKELYSGLGED